jgi:hypothetical protein
MKKKVVYIITLLVIALISLMLVKYWQHIKYKSSINDISEIDIKSHALKGMEYYSKGNFNCILIFNSNCEFCLDEIEDIVDNIDLFSNVNFYLVSTQTEKELLEYAKDSEFLEEDNFTILLDRNNNINKFFNFPGNPSTFMYNNDGKLIDFKKGFLQFYELKRMIK